MSPLEIDWQPRPGIGTSNLKTYGCGIGGEYVYGYSYRVYREVAAEKGDQRFRIKVGSATGNPIDRIYAQISASKTAVPDLPEVLVVLRTLAARHLEQWLHRRLARVTDAHGLEWFNTSPSELLSHFCDYVRTAMLSIKTEVEPPVARRQPADRAGRIQEASSSPGNSHYSKGTLIDDLLETCGVPLFRSEIAERLELDPRRVDKHIDYEIKMGRCRSDADGRVAFLRRRRRNA
ncbi:MAG TPA: GIY-YIG nuclease family protein [Lacipirellulaceae bacterium]|nr:GIY-YIG nuclease family protein [Lacipirellulaceae bacterium]HMP06904.1 GIY-YIG nuclease family protein [Lacipirellulaceae bacterium]